MIFDQEVSMRFSLTCPLVCAIVAGGFTFGTSAAVAEPPADRPSIQTNVDELLRQADASSDPAVVHATVEQIVKTYGRKAEEPLVKAMLSRPLGDVGMDIILTALIEIADPNDEHGLKSMVKRPRWVRWDPGGMMVCAVATPNDAQSQELLARVAVGELRPNPKNLGDDPAALYAAGFLRCSGNPEKVRKQVENSLWKERSLPRDYIRALLSSLDYRVSLSDAQKEKDYVEFERRLWWAYALAPKESRSGNAQYYSAAAQLEKHWKKEYEPFLRHTFQDPTSP
jgi:hypothetical protein